MVRLYLVAVVLILNCSVSPGLTLIAVAKPWMLSSPIPSISQFAAGSPSFEFSQTIGFTTGSAQGPVSAATAGAAPAPAWIKRMNAAKSTATNAEAAPLKARREWVCSVITPINAWRRGGTFVRGREKRRKKGLVRRSGAVGRVPGEGGGGGSVDRLRGSHQIQLGAIDGPGGPGEVGRAPPLPL